MILVVETRGRLEETPSTTPPKTCYYPVSRALPPPLCKKNPPAAPALASLLPVRDRREADEAREILGAGNRNFLKSLPGDR